MEEYKTLCNYECSDFDGDLIDQYKQIPNMLASQYDKTNFGPVTVIQPTEIMTNEDKTTISKLKVTMPLLDVNTHLETKFCH